MTRKLYKLITYLKVGYLLHLFTLLETFLLYWLYRLLEIGDWLKDGHLMLKLIVLFPFMTMPVFPQLDARSRYQDYKMLRDQFYFYGFQARIVKPFTKSRCQRDAALAAAAELGLAMICKMHFYGRGYRWYHIFPDFVLNRPEFLWSSHFWRTTFFAKQYKPRVDDMMVRAYKKQQEIELGLAA